MTDLKTVVADDEDMVWVWATNPDGSDRTTRCRVCRESIALTTDDILPNGKVDPAARICVDCDDMGFK
jgi:hypothetical protein